MLLSIGIKMFRIFGILCVIGLGTGGVDCTTHYRTDLQIYETQQECEAAQPPIMAETLKAFKSLNMDYQSFQMGCEKITAEEYEEWKKEKLLEDDEI